MKSKTLYSLSRHSNSREEDRQENNSEDCGGIRVGTRYRNTGGALVAPEGLGSEG